MYKKIVVGIVIILMGLSGCGGDCQNCNLDGTPFPTLEPLVVDGLH